MNRVLTAFALILAGLISSTAIGAAQDTTTAADHTSPSYDLKAQALLDLQTVQKKFVDLANTLPADKFTWRPSPDSRSFAEVFSMPQASATESLDLWEQNIRLDSTPRRSKNRRRIKLRSSPS